MPFTPFTSVAAGGVQAYQFTPETYGAVGNGRVCADVQSNTSNTYQSPTVAANGTVGQFIMIHGANGVTGVPVIGTITSIGPGNNFTVSGAAAGATVANCPAVFGTDDTAAINAAITAASNFAQGISGSGAGFGGYFAEVLFGAKIYILASGPTQQGNGTTTVTTNTQLVLPWPNPNNATQKLIIKLTGAGDTGYLQFWNSLTPNLAGTALVSMVTAPSSYSATFGPQSVIGGPTGGAGTTGAPGFTAPGGALKIANTKIIIQGIGVWCSIYTNLLAYDLSYISAIRCLQSGAHIFAPAGLNAAAIQPLLSNITAAGLTNAVSIGWKTPVGGNNLDIWMDECAAEGYEVGFAVNDHFAAGRLNAIYNDVTMRIDGAQGLSSTQHGVYVQSMAAEAYNGGLRVNNNALCQIWMNWDAEGNTPAYDVNDASNTLSGTFWYGDKIDNRAPIVTGGANLRVLSSNQARAVQGAPAYTSGTPFQNPWWQDTEVRLTGGTTSSVLIGPTSAACTQSVGTATPVTFKLPAGWWFSITQTVAPTFVAVPS